MPHSRRQFLGAVSASTLALTATPHPAFDRRRVPGEALPPADASADPYDLSWPATLRTTHRAVFDVASIESGRGVWRATLWELQYTEFLSAAAADLSSVMVIRAEAIALVMQQAFWDKYDLGRIFRVTHPLTQERTDRNPVLLSSTRREVPAAFDAHALDQYLARGRAVLACDVAFREIVQLVATADRVAQNVARERALAALVPGVKLQPSGIFAVVRAQEAGAQYVRSS
jgi:hypothetical protein